MFEINETMPYVAYDYTITNDIFTIKVSYRNDGTDWIDKFIKNHKPIPKQVWDDFIKRYNEYDDDYNTLIKELYKYTNKK